MWIPKCCSSSSSTSNPDLASKLRNEVKIFYQALISKTESGVQKNSYNPQLILTKKCSIKDRSAVAQDTAAIRGSQNPETTKELIFEYFNVTGYNFNEVHWSDSVFKVLSVSKLASVTLDGTRFIADDPTPFISIIVGMKTL